MKRFLFISLFALLAVVSVGQTDSHEIDKATYQEVQYSSDVAINDVHVILIADEENGFDIHYTAYALTSSEAHKRVEFQPPDMELKSVHNSLFKKEFSCHQSLRT